MKLIDLTGQRFGRLTVIKRAEKNGKRTMWKCVCDCGELRTIWADSLRRGSTKSCGCLDRELSIERLTTHGKTGTPEYKIWSGVTWYKPRNKWLATIGVNYESVHLGYFDNLQDAISAREAVEGRYWNGL